MCVMYGVCVCACVQCSSPKYGDMKLSSAANRHPLILHHPQMVEGVEPVGDESTTSWLYDFYPNVLGWVCSFRIPAVVMK